MSSSFDGAMALLLFDPTALEKNTVAPGAASPSSSERFFSVFKAAEVPDTITPHAVDVGAPVSSTVTKKQADKRHETWYEEVDTTIAMVRKTKVARRRCCTPPKQTFLGIQLREASSLTVSFPAYVNRQVYVLGLGRCL